MGYLILVRNVVTDSEDSCPNRGGVKFHFWLVNTPFTGREWSRNPYQFLRHYDDRPVDDYLAIPVLIDTVTRVSRTFPPKHVYRAVYLLAT